MDRFEQLSAELEQTINEPESEDEGLQKAVVSAARDYLNKGKKKGRNPSDLSADDVSGDPEDIIDPEDDPAEDPVHSGGKYPNVKKYVKKAAKCDDDDEDDDDEDDKPSFFKKKMKKSVQVEEDENTEVDATEFMESMGEAVGDLGARLSRMEKSLSHMMKGQAIFGELVADLADPRRDALNETVAKAMTYLVRQNKELAKAIGTHADVMKSIQQMPGVPRVAGMVATQENKTDELVKSEKPEMTKADTDRLFKAVNGGQISMDQYRQAKATGDLSCLK